MKLSEFSVGRNLKVLAYGHSGAGKTIFASSFPGPIFFADFDGKVSSVANYLRGSKKIDEIEFETYLPRPGEKDDRPFVRYNTKLVELENAAKAGNFPYKTVVIDSLTLYADQMLKEVVLQNPGIKRQESPTTKLTSMQDYMILNLHFKNMLVRVLQLPCNVVVTAHIQVTKDDITGEIHREAQLPGKLASFLPIMFEEVYRVYSADGKYLAQTQSSAQYNARSQIKGLPNPMVLSYSEIEKVVK